jgi:hypothetical protein
VLGKRELSSDDSLNLQFRETLALLAERLRSRASYSFSHLR